MRWARTLGPAPSRGCGREPSRLDPQLPPYSSLTANVGLFTCASALILLKKQVVMFRLSEGHQILSGAMKSGSNLGA